MEMKLLTEECVMTDDQSDILKSYRLGDMEFDVLISGIGTAFTTFHLTQTLLGNRYALVVNTGIAGSLSPELEIGQVVNVVSEEFADLGIEKESEFLTLFDSGFMAPDEFPFENQLLKADAAELIDFLPRVKGITTNISHGKESSIQMIRQKFTAQVESMEGAAVFYVCRWLGISCLQIRSVSNYVAPRSEAQWNIPLALENLRDSLTKVLQLVNVQVG